MDDEELTPEQEAELIAIYGPDGPDTFRKLMKQSKTEYPGFWGLDTDSESE